MMQQNYAADILPVRYGRDAICTIISDDGVPSTVKHLNKLAGKYDMKLTVAQVVDKIHNLKKLNKMEADGHLEFVSHSWSHLRMEDENIPEETLRHEILDAKAYMDEHFSTHQLAFVPPNNEISSKVYQVIGDAYYAIRRWKREYNDLPPQPGNDFMQWMNLGCKGIRDVETLQERNQWVDESIAQEKWLIEMWHDVNLLRRTGFQAITVREAKKHLRYIARQRDERKIWVASFVDAVKYLKEVQTCMVSMIAGQPDHWTITLSDGISGTDLRFDMPLSIGVTLPPKYRNLRIVGETFKGYDIPTQSRNNSAYAIVELNPGEKLNFIPLPG